MRLWNFWINPFGVNDTLKTIKTIKRDATVSFFIVIDVAFCYYQEKGEINEKNLLCLLYITKRC